MKRIVHIAFLRLLLRLFLRLRHNKLPTVSGATPVILALDSLDYALPLGTKIVRRTMPGYANVVRQKAQIQAEDYGLHQQISYRTPLGMGVRFGTDPRRVWAMRNVNALFSQMTRAPQKQTVTIPAGTIAYNRFQSIRGETYAMSRRLTTVGSTNRQKLYFHSVADDRGITNANLPASAGETGGGAPLTMNGAIGAAQGSTVINTATADVDGARTVIFASPPLGGQTIASQTLTVNIARSAADIATAVTSVRVRVYAFRPGSNSVVGYLLGSATATEEVATENTIAGTEQSFEQDITTTAVTVQPGDIVIAEIYVRDTTLATDVTIFYDGTTEQAVDNTTVSNHASFINFATAVAFSANVPSKVAGRLAYATASGSVLDALTDTTVDTDTNLNYCQGLVVASERIVALSAFVYSPTGGEDYKCMAQSWDGTTWENTGLNVQNNFMFIDIVDVAGSIYVLFANDISFPTWWRLSTLTGVTLSTLTTQFTVASTVLPRRLVSFPNSAGTETAWVFAADGLYLAGTLLHPWDNPASAFTGLHAQRVSINDIDSLVWQDGANWHQAFWVDSVTLKIVNRGPQSIDDGLDTTQQGNITALAVGAERKWVASCVGGEDASHNASVIVHDGRHMYKTQDSDEPQPLMNCPYYNTTANRIVRAATFTREPDGRGYFIFAEDNGTTDDVDVFFFDLIFEDPLSISTYPYSAANAVILTSQVKPLKGLQNVGFLAIQVDAENLSAAAKRIRIRDGQNGAAVADYQIIVSGTSPSQVWPDQTADPVVAGVGVAARSQQVEINLDDTGGANSTVGPTLNEFVMTYMVGGFLPDNTLAEEFEFVVDLAESSFLDGNRGDPKAVFAALQTTAQRQILVPLVLDAGETVYVQPFIVAAPLNPQLQAAIQQKPADGFVTILCRQLLR